MRKLHIRASRERTFDSINLFVFNEDTTTHKVYQGKITFKEVPEGGRCDTTLELDRLNLTMGNVAQVLMDDLWECGIRPSEGQGSAGQLKAVQDHLTDMRKITFHKLNIEEK